MDKNLIIETPRLILRPVTLEDAEACFAIHSDERVAKYMVYSAFTDIGQTVDWINSTFEAENRWNWAFALKGENRVIGCGTVSPCAEMKGYWEIGYNLNYGYWHRGYCTEAMRAVVDFAHKNLGIDKICSNHAIDNPRSGRVLENCGLEFYRYGEFSKAEVSRAFKAKFYKREWPCSV